MMLNTKLLTNIFGDLSRKFGTKFVCRFVMGVQMYFASSSIYFDPSYFIDQESWLPASILGDHFPLQGLCFISQLGG